MAQPLENVVALAQANIRLGLQLAETWRGSGQKLIELGTKGASEIGEETRLTLAKSVSPDKGASVNSVNGHWQDMLAEIETVRTATAQEIEAAVGKWRKSWADALTVEPTLPVEALFKPWLALVRPTAPTPPAKAQAQEKHVPAKKS
ncbi:hypothetical protein SAMN06295912_14416 [Sphingomonas laterariae]|uniref:Phasin protein n=1 Tax=Edaphosphingomonas laterariae TaxID=861865 RepID=A0A239K2R8_9SPHN|nr:hypothetical protein [Sphingomonas laterariae]SNT12331.1 hypothetical protein SAMN06295912_14416 [Sphingomonas laterariae]